MRPILLSIILTTATTILPAAAQEYADTVHSFFPGVGDLGSVDLISNVPCRGSGRPLDLSDALGAPNDKFVSVGDEGTITLAFPHVIEDLPGPDVRVWVSCNNSCEPGEVSATQDGLVFVSLGPLQTPPFVEYDLAGAGLAFATLIRVHDRPGTNCPSFGLAVDLDTVESLHPGETVPVAPRSWSIVRTMYR